MKRLWIIALALPLLGAADDEMRVEGTTGTISLEAVEARFLERWSAIEHCYQDEHDKFSYLGGRLVLRLHIDAAGKLTQAFVASSTVGSHSVERCVLEIARSITFPTPHDGSVELSYPIHFRGQAKVRNFSDAELKTSRTDRQKDFVWCRHRAPAPDEVTLTVYVAPGGKVISAGFSAPAPVDEKFASCLLEKTSAWRFADPLGQIAKASTKISR